MVARLEFFGMVVKKRKKNGFLHLLELPRGCSQLLLKTVSDRPLSICSSELTSLFPPHDFSFLPRPAETFLVYWILHHMFWRNGFEGGGEYFIRGLQCRSAEVRWQSLDIYNPLIVWFPRSVPCRPQHAQPAARMGRVRSPPVQVDTRTPDCSILPTPALKSTSALHLHYVAIGYAALVDAGVTHDASVCVLQEYVVDTPLLWGHTIFQVALLRVQQAVFRWLEEGVDQGHPMFLRKQ